MKRILLINDDLVQLELYALWLQAAGYTADQFQNPEDALLCLHDHAHSEDCPELIITDLYMPYIDGWKVCRLLRSAEYKQCNHIPILVMSATFSGKEVVGLTQKIGANAFLSIPVKNHVFLETVGSLLDGQKPHYIPKILLVEDSTSLLPYIENVFRSHNFMVKSATTGSRAFHYIDKEEFDIIILDYHLPDIEGDEILELSHKKNRKSVFIMMTTDPDPKLAVKWMKSGASAYLKKPFDPDYLLSICNQTLRERRLIHIEELLEERTRQLWDKNSQYVSLLENSPAIIARLDTEKKIEIANKKFLALINMSQDEVAGRVVSKIGLPSNIVDTINQVFDTVWTNGDPVECDFHWDDNGTVRWFDCKLAPEKNKKGQICSILAVVIEITKERKIRQALEKSLSEKKVLLQEIHHRVKNNLNIIASLLHLQSQTLSDIRTKKYFDDTKARVASLALIHEKLYQSEELSGINLRVYFEDIISRLIDAYRRDEIIIRSYVTVPELCVAIEKAVPLGLITNELISNALEHGLSGVKEGRLELIVEEQTPLSSITIKDNGPGLPLDLDLKQKQSLGLTLVSALAEQVDGDFSLRTENGTVAIVRFKL